MTPQAQRLLAAIERVPLTSLEILHQLGIARASARVYELRHELASEGRTVSTEIVPVENRYGETCRVARYAVIRCGVQADLWAVAERGREAA